MDLGGGGWEDLKGQRQVLKDGSGTLVGCVCLDGSSQAPMWHL